MKLFGQIENALVLSSKKEESKKEAGRFFYKVGVFFPESKELGELPCNEEIYNAVQSIEGSGKFVNFGFYYNTDFKSITLYSVNASKSKA